MRDCQATGTVSTIVKIMFDDSSLSDFDKEETVTIKYEFHRDTLIPENRQVESLSILDVTPDWILSAMGEDKTKKLCLQLMEYQE